MPLPPLVYQDDALVVFDKPCGLAVDPALMAQARIALGPALTAVHRLDPEASGLLLCARTKPALDFLSGQFQSKTAERVYFALVAVLPPERLGSALAPARAPEGGLPAAFEIDLAIAPDPRRPEAARATRKRGGQPSATAFSVLESFGRFAWLECRPRTGRRHQVRLHLAAAGAPALNDSLYGDPEARLLLSELKRGYKGREAERPLLARLALHAGILTFSHPASRELMTLRSPLPQEFEVALKYLRKFGGGAPARKPRGAG